MVNRIFCAINIYSGFSHFVMLKIIYMLQYLAVFTLLILILLTDNKFLEHAILN